MTARFFTSADNGAAVQANIGDTIAVTLDGIGWSFTSTGAALGAVTVTTASDLSSQTGTYTVVANGGGIVSAANSGNPTSFALTVSTGAPAAPVLSSAPAAPVFSSGSSPVPLGPMNLTPLLAWLSQLSNVYLTANSALLQGANMWQGQLHGTQANPPTTLTIAQTEVAELTSAGNDLLEATATVTSPSTGLASLYIPPTTQALRAALLELEAWRSGTMTSAPSGVSKGAAVGIGAGAATFGGIVGGFIGHAIGAGLIFAGEARESAAREGRGKGKRKRHGRA